MTQSIVNFIVDSDPSITNTAFATDPRVFDFEISEDAQTYYSSQMQALKTTFFDLAIGVDINVTLPNISSILNKLNSWSQLRVVRANVQVIDSATGLSAGFKTAQTYEVNGNLMPIDLDGNVLSVAFDTNGNIIFDTNGKATILQDLPPPTFTDGSTVLTSTMDRYMAEQFDKILRTFRAAGWDPISNPVTSFPTTDESVNNAIRTGLLHIFNNAAVYGILDTTPAGTIDFTTPANNTVKGLLSKAIDIAGGAHILGKAAATQSDSLQQILMVDYIERGNELLFNEMGQLKDAINVNQTSLRFLNSLQDLMNQKDPAHFVLELQLLNNLGALDATTQLDKVNNFESQSYNQAINVLSKITSNDPQAIANFLTQSTGVDVGSQTLLANLTSPDITAVMNVLKSLLPQNILANFTDADTTALTSFAGLIAGSNQTTAPEFWLNNTLSYFQYPSNLQTSFQTFINSMPVEQQASITALLPSLTTAIPTAIRNNLIFAALQQTTSNDPIVTPAVLALSQSEQSDALFLQFSNIVGLTVPGMDTALHDLTDSLQPLGGTIGFTLDGTNINILANLLTNATAQLSPADRALITPNVIATLSFNIANRNSSGLYGSLLILSGFNPNASHNPDDDPFGTIDALAHLASSIAALNASGTSSDLLSKDVTKVQNVVQTLVNNLTSLPQTEQTYLNSILPTIAQGFAANNQTNGGTTTTPLARGVFEDIRSSLTTVFTYSKQQIIDNLDFLATQIRAKGKTAADPLVLAFNKIKADFQSVATIQAWIEDSGADTSGNFQRDLNDGLVASQSFNDTQREELSRIMFVFEEFYKSASALLSGLTQLIQKIASAIAR